MFLNKSNYLLHYDLLEKIRYYLTYLDEVQKIATAGYEHLLGHHTYAHRAKELMDIIETVNATKSKS